MTLRLIEWPTTVTIFLDVALWFAIHMGVSAFVTGLNENSLPKGKFPFRLFPWENRFYERILLIRVWKAWLPDAAPWFGGLPKKNLHGRSSSGLESFLKEAMRGEFSHWAIVALSPVFFLFNQLWVGFFMVGFGLMINLPCIVVQRYNRARLLKIVGR